MISSTTVSSSRDQNSGLEQSKDVPSNFPMQHRDGKMESLTDINIPRFQGVVPPASPFLYVHHSNNALYVAPNSPNTFIQTTPPIPITKTSLPQKTIPGISVASNSNVLLPSKHSNMKSQQILIQKGGTLVLKPVNLESYTENVQGSKIHITTTASFVQKPVQPKIVFTSLHKPTGLTTTNTMQPNLAFLPLNVPSTTNDIPGNKFKIVSPSVLNLQIGDETLQAPSSPVNIICDSNSSSSDNDNRLICSEVIDLDSPEKEEQSSGEDVMISNNDILETNVKKPKEIKFPTYGVSILKKNLKFTKGSPNDITKQFLISQSISSSPATKDVTPTVEPKVSSEEFKIIPNISQKSGRRKSSFCFRKEFDDSIEFIDEPVDLQKSLQDNGISLTRAENIDADASEKNEEDDLEINLIKPENVEDEVALPDCDTMIEWEDGIGKLPGSNLKFILNEFDMVELITNPESEDINKNSKPKDKSKEEYIRCIQCGCYGLLSDFVSPKYCSISCKEKRKEIIKEKELKHKKKKKLKKREVEDIKNDDGSESSIDNVYNNRVPYFWKCKSKEFSWAKYLEFTKSQSAPIKLFADPFPYSKNKFKPGMKLEGIDPHHPSHFCILTVADVQGYRMKLHFDGFSKDYDFWVNADSNGIFPLGWCEKNGRYLNPPPDYADREFNWVQYVKETRSLTAPKSAFPDRSRNGICPIGFRIGMKLEAVDMKNNTSMVCVATVRDILENRILIHFDSWDDIYDYWTDPSSPYIHPIGWCDKFGHSLTPPNDYENPEDFTWDVYLKETNSLPAPVRAFKQKAACGFKKGMKLECVDKRIPQLIRVATVADVKDHQIRVQFDGWMEKYSYWIEDDSPDIHPATWCQKTGHPLEAPLTPDDFYEFLECPTIGCRGVGHASGPRYSTHASAEDCPLSDYNLFSEKKLRDRLLSPGRSVESVVPVSREPKEKIKAKLGRPRKRYFAEIKNESNDEFEVDCKKPARTNDIVDKSTEDRIMNFIQDLTVVKAEKESLALHSKFLVSYTNTDSDPITWSVSEVASFIQSLPIGSDYSEVFRKHLIDGAALLLITQNDIMDVLNIKLGPAIILYNSIVLLRNKAFNIFKQE